MKKILLIFGFIFCVSTLSAQDVKGKYIMRTTDEGSLLFFFPQKGYKNKSLSGNIEYDITYSTVSDSVTINFTYKSDKALPLDSAMLQNKTFTEKPAASMIYIEPDGNKWVQRASIKMPVERFRAFYKNENPVNMLLFSKGNEYKCEMASKAWKKNTAVMNKVFEILDMNISSK